MALSFSRGDPASSYLKGRSIFSPQLVLIRLHALDFGFLGLTRREAAFFLPQHVTEREELTPQLGVLLSHFNIPYDLEELRDAAQEIELLNLVLDGLFLNTKIGVCERKYYCLPQNTTILPQLFLE